MSDLIERVARAIQTADGSPGHNTDGCWNCGVEARAAIREVATWLDDSHKYLDPDGDVALELRKAAGETK